MNGCLVCLEPIDGARYHTKCLRELFGVAVAPEIDIELAKLHTVALAMVGHTSLSGIQRKVSVSLEGQGRTMQVATEGGRFILKPQAQTFPSLPENEHVTMRIARRCGVAIPPCGLVELKDGSLAYISRRFDRTDGGRKLMQEDFCQLAGLSPKEKYQGSAELCAKLVLRHASAPVVETAKLFRLLAFLWWTGNGDMHLKNFSLLRGEDGHHRLSPAYDLLCTRLVIEEDPLALPIGGNKNNIRRREWLAFANRCGVKERVAERVLRELGEATEDALGLVSRSALPDEMKDSYQALLRQRGKVLLA